MIIHGNKFRFTLQRVSSKSAVSTSLHGTVRGQHNNGSDNAGKYNAPNGRDNSPCLGGYLRGVYTTLKGGRRAYYSLTSFGARWDRIQQNLAVLGRTSTGNTVVPYHDSGEAFRVMWNAVDEAKRSVLWQTYICKDDHVGQMTVAKLEAAHWRGCYTELLYDCGGNITGRRRLVGDLKQSGVTVIEHRPILKHLFPYLLGGMKWERSPAIRNHRKILLCDNRIGFCGGLNVGDEYCGRSQGGSGRFRDTHCSVMGPVVAHLREVYEDTKAPKPWKWSWTRWRQIASATVRRRREEGRSVKNNILFPSRSVQQRGRVYLRRQMERAEKGRVMLMERMRWRRQRERLQNFVQWYMKDVGDATRCSSDLTPQSDERILNVASGNGAGGTSSVMQQRIGLCRMRTPFRVKAVFNRRMGARGGAVMSLSDTEPIPEAEAYGKTHLAVTQVLCCNPHARDWSIPYALWQVSKNAYRRLWVTTPYYMPHRKLMRSILGAARRGVDVRILAGSNQTTDPWFMWYASNYITERLLRAGVRIYEYKGNQVMHAKTVVVDSIWSSVGSYNWDMMSNKNMEVCVCHLDYNLAREMERQFLADLEVSIEVKYDEYKHRSWCLRFLSWFFYVGLQIAEKLTFHTFWDADLSSRIDGLD